MTTQTIEIEGRTFVPEGRLGRAWRHVRGGLARAGVAAVASTVSSVAAVVGAKAVPQIRHIKEHGYTLLGFGCVDAAMFVHSTYVGLLATGISWVVFEWKVKEEGKDESAKR